MPSLVSPGRSRTATAEAVAPCSRPGSTPAFGAAAVLVYGFVDDGSGRELLKLPALP